MVVCNPYFLLNRVQLDIRLKRKLCHCQNMFLSGILYGKINYHAQILRLLSNSLETGENAEDSGDEEEASDE